MIAELGEVQVTLDELVMADGKEGNRPPGRRGSILDSMSSISGDSLFQEHFADGSSTQEDGSANHAVITLYGRTEEIAIITSLYDHVSQVDDKLAELLVVSGNSGTGKSALVEILRCHVAKQHTGYFVGSKFDPLRVPEPYSAVVEVFSDLCDLVLLSNQLPVIRRALNKALGPETKILSKTIANFSKVCGVPSDHFTQFTAEVRSYPRFTHLCQTFLQTVSCFLKPLVLFLDDLQWADENSIGLIRTLIQDKELRNVVVVLSFRENDLESSTEAGKLMKSLDTVAHLPLTKVRLKNLDLDAINHLISDCLGQEKVDTLSLSKVVYRKTKGNIYHVVQFLETLQVEDLLVYIEHIAKWSWDIHRIQKETSLSDNVVEMVLGRILRLDDEAQQFLVLAAHLGHHFPYDVLKVVATNCLEVVSSKSNYSSAPQSKKAPPDVEASLKAAVAGGFLEACVDKKFKFSHDRVQHCVYEMVDDGRNRELLQLEIGRAIYKKMVESKAKVSDLVTFLATDNLNRGSTHMELDSERVTLARLNLQAAKRSNAKAAMFMAREYLRQGRDLLALSDWKTSYDLCLEVHNTSLEVLNHTGNEANCRALVDIVLKNARNLHDSMRAYRVLVTVLSKSNFDEALQIGCSVLQKLGEPMPKKPKGSHETAEYNKVKKYLKTRKVDLTSLSMMKDANKKAAIRMLGTLSSITFMNPATHFIFVIVGLRIMRLTCEYGLSEWSPTGVACYALADASLKRYSEGYQYGMIAMKLMQKFKFKSAEPRTLLVLYSLVMHWKRPLTESLDALMRSYRRGVRTGDLEFGFAAANSYLMAAFMTGEPLGDLEEDAKLICGQMADFKLNHLLAMSLPLWQLVQNLLNRSEKVIVLQGDAMDEEELMSRIYQQQNVVAIQTLLFCKMHLYLGFEEWTLLEEVLPLVENNQKSMNLHLSRYFFVFNAAMGYFALYAETKKNEFLRRARRLHKDVQRWADDGVTNCVPLHKVLHAELLAVKGDARAAFDEAISSCAQHGFLYCETLAVRAAARWMLRTKKLPQAKTYLRKCMDLCRQWENKGLASFLETKYRALLSNNSQPSAGYVR